MIVIIHRGKHLTTMTTCYWEIMEASSFKIEISFNVSTETLAQLNSEAFAHILGTLDFGLYLQDLEVVNMCLGALQAPASYHYREMCAGKTGLGLHAAGQGSLSEGIFSRFLRSLLQLLLFEDYSPDLVSAAADALLPSILCEQGPYQRLGNELIERQANSTLKSRLQMRCILSRVQTISPQL